MAAGQGIRRVARGITRPLSKSEIDRGYVFLTWDRRIGELLEVDSFSVDWLGVQLECRRLNRGRFQVPRSLVSGLEGVSLRMQVVDRETVRVSRAV